MIFFSFEPEVFFSSVVTFGPPVFISVIMVNTNSGYYSSDLVAAGVVSFDSDCLESVDFESSLLSVGAE